MIPSDGWVPTASHTRAVLGGLMLAVAAITLRRPELLVLATPLLAVAVWSVLLRPTESPRVNQGVAHPSIREGDATTWTISVEDNEGLVDDVAAVFDPPALSDLEPVSGQVMATMSARSPLPPGEAQPTRVQMSVALRPTRWGRHLLNPVLIVASSGWNGFRHASLSPSLGRVNALPNPLLFDPVAASVRARGLVGDNRSPRPGVGAEFASIRLFQPGDKLRRIHWPATLRTGKPHVASTWADHDRHVALLVDAFDDVGESDSAAGQSSSLDMALRAGAAIAEHYIQTGNRVALSTMGAHGVMRVPAGSGFVHLRRILDAMVRSKSSSGRFDGGQVERGLSRDALVVMLSPLLSPGVHKRLATLVSNGYRVVVIDCLPTDIAEQSPRDPYHSIAWRMAKLQREEKLRHIRAAGIAVLVWNGPGTLDQVLQGYHGNAAKPSSVLVPGGRVQ